MSKFAPRILVPRLKSLGIDFKHVCHPMFKLVKVFISINYNFLCNKFLLRRDLITQLTPLGRRFWFV